MSQTSWFGSAQAIRMFLRICGGSLPRFTWPTVRNCAPPVLSKLISGVVGSAGRDTSAAGSGSPVSMGLRASSP